jgi:hypothetical protein
MLRYAGPASLFARFNEHGQEIALSDLLGAPGAWRPPGLHEVSVGSKGHRAFLWVGNLRPHRPPVASHRVLRPITESWSGRLRRLHRSPASATAFSSSAVRAAAKSLKLQGKLLSAGGAGRSGRKSMALRGGVRSRERPRSFLRPETLTSPVSSNGWPARPIWGSGACHMLRYACGYKPANDGHDTRAIQAYLGHRNIQNTTRYTALAPQRFEEFFRD